MKTLLFVALVIATPANAATAIVCNTSDTMTAFDPNETPTEKVEVKEVVRTFIIDDVAKTFKEVNSKTGGVDTFCDGCQIEFGPSQIKATRISGVSVSQTFANYYFTLDRVAGTVEADFLFHALKSGRSDKHKMTGTCKKTAMPKLGNAKAQF